MKNTVNSVAVAVMVLAPTVHLRFIVMDMAVTSVYGVAQHQQALAQKVPTKFMKNKE